MDEPRRILVVGNGGRECALSCALLLSPTVEALYITPANWGVVDPSAATSGSRVHTLDIKVGDHAALVKAAGDHGIDLAVVGPEQPLVDGVADELRNAGIPVVGPGREGAQLEGSKLNAKEFMARHGIPTGGFESFTDYAAMKTYIERLDGPCVLKADGLAAGKGVIVCSSREEALAGAKRIMGDREFGVSGDLALVEERLYGNEISFTCLVSGTEARPRLTVFRSTKHIYAQIIDDEAGRTLVAASTVDKELRGEIGYGGNKDAAIAIGKALADRALKAGITAVAFDRSEYKYHGRVAALADAAREAGLVI